MNEPRGKQLSGISVLVTRPAGDTATLVTMIERLGANAIACPTIEIVPRPVAAADWPPSAGVVASIFTSKAAVECGAQAWQSHYLGAHPACAVGPATAELLKQFGPGEVVVPTQDFTSEGLLALELLSASKIRGRTVVLVKGVGGRDLLPEALTSRGAMVAQIECYARHKTRDSLRQAVTRAGVSCPDYAVVSSAESLVNLADKISADALPACLGTQLLVSSPRIAARAAALGFTRDPLVVDNPSNENFTRRLLALAGENP